MKKVLIVLLALVVTAGLFAGGDASSAHRVLRHLVWLLVARARAVAYRAAAEPGGRRCVGRDGLSGIPPSGDRWARGGVCVADCIEQGAGMPGYARRYLTLVVLLLLAIGAMWGMQIVRQSSTTSDGERVVMVADIDIWRRTRRERLVSMPFILAELW